MRKKKYGYGLGQGIFGQRIRLTRSPRLHPQIPAHVTVVWGSQKHTYRNFSLRNRFVLRCPLVSGE